MSPSLSLPIVIIDHTAQAKPVHAAQAKPKLDHNSVALVGDGSNRFMWGTMPSITPEFCWSESERLTKLAIASIDRANRNELLDIAAHYRQIAAQLLSERADIANSNEVEGKGSGAV